MQRRPRSHNFASGELTRVMCETLVSFVTREYSRCKIGEWFPLERTDTRAVDAQKATSLDPRDPRASTRDPRASLRDTTHSRDREVISWHLCNAEKMPRLNVATRKRIIILTRRGYTVDAIHKRLEEERTYVNVRSIQRLLAKFKLYHTINDLKRKPRRRLLSPEMIDHVENLLQSDDELTARKLRDDLCGNYGANDIIPSISTIKRYEFNIMASKLQNTCIGIASSLAGHAPGPTIAS